MAGHEVHPACFDGTPPARVAPGVGGKGFRKTGLDHLGGSSLTPLSAAGRRLVFEWNRW